MSRGLDLAQASLKRHSGVQVCPGGVLDLVYAGQTQMDWRGMGNAERTRIHDFSQCGDEYGSHNAMAKTQYGGLLQRPHVS